MIPYTPEMVHLTKMIEQAHTRRVLAEEVEAHEIKIGRMNGLTWKIIGEAVGTSTQAAWERYGLTYQQRLEVARQQERRWTEPELDLEGLPPSVAPDKGRVSRKRKRTEQADQG